MLLDHRRGRDFKVGADPCLIVVPLARLVIHLPEEDLRVPNQRTNHRIDEPERWAGASCQRGWWRFLCAEWLSNGWRQRGRCGAHGLNAAEM